MFSHVRRAGGRQLTPHQALHDQLRQCFPGGVKSLAEAYFSIYYPILKLFVTSRILKENTFFIACRFGLRDIVKMIAEQSKFSEPSSIYAMCTDGMEATFLSRHFDIIGDLLREVVDTGDMAVTERKEDVPSVQDISSLLGQVGRWKDRIQSSDLDEIVKQKGLQEKDMIHFWLLEARDKSRSNSS